MTRKKNPIPEVEAFTPEEPVESDEAARNRFEAAMKPVTPITKCAFECDDHICEVPHSVHTLSFHSGLRSHPCKCGKPASDKVHAP